MKFFHNIIVKNILLTILPIIYTTLVSICFSNFSDVLLTWSIISFVLHMVLLILYGYKEAQQKKEYKKTEMLIKKTEAVTKAYKEADEFIQDNADMLYQLVYNKKGHSEVENWDLLRTKGDIICNSVFELVRNVAEKGNDFAISIIFRRIKDNKSEYTMLSRKTNFNSYKPEMYRNFISDEKAKDTFYKKIFDESPRKPQILKDKRKIKEKFAMSNDIEYSQYIGFPIFCKSKIVAILQIVSYKESLIANNEKALKRLCDDYISLFANLFLLSDKLENVQQIIKG